MVIIDWVMKFMRFWSFSIEILLKLYFPFVKKIPLDPPFSKGEFAHRGAFPLFEKACPELSRREGSGEILDSAEKPLGMLRRTQHERKNSNDFNRSSVRPEALEG